MPIGSWSAFIDIVRGVLSTRPKSVLDIGIGFGMNGAAIRNWYDLGVKPFQTRLEGVEVWEEYENPLWELYDQIHKTDVRDFLKHNTFWKWDLIIMTDVIEHFSKPDGIKLLNELKKRCNKAIIVSTPAIWIEQGAVHGNSYETHKSFWTVRDFQDLGFGIVRNGVKDQYGHCMIIADYIKH